MLSPLNREFHLATFFTKANQHIGQCAAVFSNIGKCASSHHYVTTSVIPIDPTRRHIEPDK